ncbi:hypothetical protein F4813DRAFT_400160 [Daldinia decipiens]|uniref:uncharacterized protein n=1 Tax=Daldinia decipiens TaxID=326647 RepID=UPI0020C40C82|nr:uncharacterized protein F4813DRAFT_400160 [Daldinia decipiens]KAI1660999.1 hypothetical protein F4813DRAFT_400160 [Daldinia decipiens]
MSVTAESNPSDDINSNTNNDAIPCPDINTNDTTEAQDNTNTTNIAPEPGNIEPENASPNPNNLESNISETPPPNNIQPPTVSPETTSPEISPHPATATPPTPKVRSPGLSPQDSELDKPLPLTFWLLAGGTGAPPSTSSLLRMTSERNAATREAEARAIARKQALEERRAYLAHWDEEWGPVGVKGLLAKVFRSKKRKT